MRDSYILALDTTTNHGSVALCCNGRLVAERRWTAAESHSTMLLPEIEASMRACGTGWGDLTHLVAVNGPGSFTGIRIGLGTVQGLAHALGRPILAVSALEALANAAPVETRPIHAVLDARRNQVFHQLFNRSTQAAPLPSYPPQCEEGAEWLRRLPKTPGRFIGSGALLYRREIEKLGGAYLVLPALDFLAGQAAQIAAQRISSGTDHGGITINALYLRPPDVLLPKAGR